MDDGVTGPGRPPVCARCGGTGYVYLWSLPVDGSHVWFCDRSSCKRFWTEPGALGNSITDSASLVHELQSPVPATEERVLQPV